MSIIEETPAAEPVSTDQDGSSDTFRVRGAGAQLVAALRMLIVLTVILGVVYPLGTTLVARLPWWSGPADGSIVTAGGTAVGSELLGQSFSDAEGNPLAQWFQPRLSAAGDGYDGASSSASNLGPSNPDLLTRIADSRTSIADFNGVSVDQVPDDALTTSGSGLDPDISPEYARLQAARVAQARGLDPGAVLKLVEEHVDGRTLGFIGQAHVNVLLLNRDLAGLQ